MFFVRNQSVPVPISNARRPTLNGAAHQLLCLAANIRPPYTVALLFISWLIDHELRSGIIAEGDACCAVRSVLIALRRSARSSRGVVGILAGGAAAALLIMQHRMKVQPRTTAAKACGDTVLQLFVPDTKDIARL